LVVSASGSGQARKQAAFALAAALMRRQTSSRLSSVTPCTWSNRAGAQRTWLAFYQGLPALRRACKQTCRQRMLFQRDELGHVAVFFVQTSVRSVHGDTVAGNWSARSPVIFVSHFLVPEQSFCGFGRQGLHVRVSQRRTLRGR